MTIEAIRDFFNTMVHGASIGNWCVFGGTVFVLQFVLNWLRRRLVRKLEAMERETPPRGNVLLRELFHRTLGTSIFFASMAVISGVSLYIPADVRDVLGRIATIAIWIQLGLWGNVLLNLALETSVKRFELEGSKIESARGVVRFFALLAVWSAVLLLILSTLGQPVAPLLAGLGIGGIAVGFALQRILGDIFCSIAIVLDKPFEVGDFISTGAEAGTVEQIGIKTTRVRSVNGEQIVFSNADLLDSRVRNFKRMQERRVLFAFGVLYSTTEKQLEAIPGWVEEIIRAMPLARFDRAHFKSFGESSLDFEVVYFLTSGDYKQYMDTQQAINLGLVRKFAAEGIGFAFPTRTLQIDALVPVRLAGAPGAVSTDHTAKS